MPVGVIVRSKQNLQQEIIAGKHRWVADEPLESGGDDQGPNPYDMLLGALGACTSMTLLLYAKHKQWPLEDVQVELTHERIHAEDCQDCVTKEGSISRITRNITVSGLLNGEQIAQLKDVAMRCPVHKTLMSEIQVVDTIFHSALNP